jgi:hypothetical protein
VRTHFRDWSALEVSRYIRSLISSHRRINVDKRTRSVSPTRPGATRRCPRAPPLPPADTDDLAWLEAEFRLRRLAAWSISMPRRSFRHACAGAAVAAVHAHAGPLGHALLQARARHCATNVSCFHPPKASDRPLSSHDPIRCGVDFHEPRNATHAHRHAVKAGSLVSILKHFRMPPHWHYCEVNPVTVKQWSDVLVGSPLLRDAADRPTNLIVLRRNMARTAKSMIEAGWFSTAVEPPGVPVAEQRCARMLYESARAGRVSGALQRAQRPARRRSVGRV